MPFCSAKAKMKENDPLILARKGGVEILLRYQGCNVVALSKGDYAAIRLSYVHYHGAKLMPFHSLRGCMKGFI